MERINIWSAEERKKEENIWFAGEVGNRKGGKRKRKISFFVEEKENGEGKYLEKDNY